MLNIEKFYTRVLQVSTVILSVVLFWFAFVYYPAIIKDLKAGKFISFSRLFKPVVATSYKFPIETSAYRIEAGQAAGNYYVYIGGRDLLEYEVNRSSSKLALKSALSLESICEVTVFYISAANLSIPQNLKADECSGR